MPITRLLPVLPVLILVALLAGCDKDRADRGPAGEAVVLAPVRPAALIQAEREVRSGQAPQAEARLRGWLAQNAQSPYQPEAQYLLAQTRAAQGDYQGAKKLHDEVADHAQDRTLKALALFGRADCNMQLQEYHLASRQYHWLEQFYRDVNALPQEELLFKLGLCSKLAGFPETADYWFDKVIELYATGNYAAQARQMHSQLGPAQSGDPTYYSLEVASYSDEKTALAEAQTYRDKGYRDVAVREVSMLGTPYYCVTIGKFFNRTDALRAKEDAQFAGLNPSIRPGWIAIPK